MHYNIRMQCDRGGLQNWHGDPNHPQNIAPANQSTFISPDEHLDISMLETWLWDAACAIRGSTDAPKFKDFILPLVFFKRLSDVFDDEFAAHVKEYGDEAVAREIIEADLAHALKSGNPLLASPEPKDEEPTAELGGPRLRAVHITEKKR